MFTSGELLFTTGQHSSKGHLAPGCVSKLLLLFLVSVRPAY